MRRRCSVSRCCNNVNFLSSTRFVEIVRPLHDNDKIVLREREAKEHEQDEPDDARRQPARGPSRNGGVSGVRRQFRQKANEPRHRWARSIYSLYI